MLIWAALLVGCGGPVDCSEQPAGMDRDLCLHDQALLLPAAQVEPFVVTVQQIQDPIVRGSAVFAWMNVHARELNPQQGVPICNLLESRERTSCNRKVSAIHLRR